MFNAATQWQQVAKLINKEEKATVMKCKFLSSPFSHVRPTSILFQKAEILNTLNNSKNLSHHK